MAAGKTPRRTITPSLSRVGGSCPHYARLAAFRILILFFSGYYVAMRRTSRRKPSQPAFLWPGTDEVCPRCHGARQVYHRVVPPGVEILGGKRMACPVCQAVGTVRTPTTTLIFDPSAVKPGIAKT